MLIRLLVLALLVSSFAFAAGDDAHENIFFKTLSHIFSKGSVSEAVSSMPVDEMRAVRVLPHHQSSHDVAIEDVVLRPCLMHHLRMTSLRGHEEFGGLSFMATNISDWRDMVAAHYQAKGNLAYSLVGMQGILACFYDLLSLESDSSFTNQTKMEFIADILEIDNQKSVVQFERLFPKHLYRITVDADNPDVANESAVKKLMQKMNDHHIQFQIKPGDSNIFHLCIEHFFHLEIHWQLPAEKIMCRFFCKNQRHTKSSVTFLAFHNQNMNYHHDVTSHTKYIAVPLKDNRVFLCRYNVVDSDDLHFISESEFEYLYVWDKDHRIWQPQFVHRVALLEIPDFQHQTFENVLNTQMPSLISPLLHTFDQPFSEAQEYSITFKQTLNVANPDRILRRRSSLSDLVPDILTHGVTEKITRNPHLKIDHPYSFSIIDLRTGHFCYSQIVMDDAYLKEYVEGDPQLSAFSFDEEETKDDEASKS